MRRVRLLAYTDNAELGGADLSMANLLERLDPSFDVTVMGLDEAIVDRIAMARPSASTVVVRRPTSGHDVRSLAAHTRAMRKVAPHIVHANLSSPWSCQYCIAAAALLRRPRVVAVYHLAVSPTNERQRWMKRLTSRAIDRHVGVGEQMSHEVEAVVGLPRGTLVTIHNGIPDRVAEPLPRRRPGWLIGAIGRLEWQKGFDVLIKALPIVDGASLVVVGEGSERAALERLAHDVGVSDRILWEGWSDTPQAHLRSIDVLAVPSRFEGSPLVILEALLAGTPVVAADVGSVSEAVHDGETGLLVPPEDAVALADALRRLLTDDALRARFLKQGPGIVRERFLAAHMTAAFQSLYREILS
jgi:glycosyltransferase involved in cell wall biosynthesis